MIFLKILYMIGILYYILKDITLQFWNMLLFFMMRISLRIYYKIAHIKFKKLI